jgi:hypothetical protein
MTLISIFVKIPKIKILWKSSLFKEKIGEHVWWITLYNIVINTYAASSIITRLTTFLRQRALSIRKSDAWILYLRPNSANRSCEKKSKFFDTS